MNLSQKKDQLEQAVGAAILWSQPVEQGLKTVLTLLSQNEADVDLSRPYDWLKGRKTFGPLIDLLRTKVIIPATIDNILQEFLDDRNLLVHRFFEHYDLYDPDDYDSAMAMISRLRRNTDILHNILRTIIFEPHKAFLNYSSAAGSTL